MGNEDLMKKVELYLSRFKNCDRELHYPLDKEGCWHIVGGFDNTFETIGVQKIRVPHRRKVKQAYCTGAFVDIVAYAVEDPGFYAIDGDLNDPSSTNNGYVEFFSPAFTAPKSGLLEKLSQKSR